MYLYLGQETVIKKSSIIGIFDIDNTTTSKITREFLSKKQKKNQVIEVSADIPKSFVVCSNKYGEKLYLSQISPATLKRRYDDINKIVE